MILAFSLPPEFSLYMAVIGGAVAIALAKGIFGGLGHNLFNPAMVGRAFLMICFPAAMGMWTAPEMVFENLGRDGATMATPGMDGATMATPLQATAEHLPGLKAMFVGQVGGCVCETSALAVLLGGLYLVVRGVADWRLVAGTLAGAAVFATIAHWADPQAYQGAAYHLVAGSLLFGAFFIATDYVGAPITPSGRWIFGLGVGVLVMVIRLFGAYPEGVMFAILIMNALTPLIERITIPTPFGGHVPAT
jgi:electron transport complex protein RnfD